jgi:AcrR family transcriptional regulator
MSTVSRRERDRVRVRERLLAVALEILHREGPGALTVRRIAGDVDYTSPIVYQHFANKDALLLAVVEVGYARMLEHLRASVGQRTAEQRVLAATRAYVEFAAGNPHLFRMMNDTTLDPGERYRIASDVITFVVTTLADWADENGVTLDDPQETSEIAWGVALGIANLGLLGTVGADRATHLAAQAMRALMLAWATPPP